MIRITVSYPHQGGARFDLDYYTGKHFRLVDQKLRPLGLIGWAADQGLSGLMPGSDPDFIIQAQMVFETLEAAQAALAAEGPALVADIPNFTDIQPRIQISNVLIQHVPMLAAGA